MCRFRLYSLLTALFQCSYTPRLTGPYFLPEGGLFAIDASCRKLSVYRYGEAPEVSDKPPSQGAGDALARIGGTVGFWDHAEEVPEQCGKADEGEEPVGVAADELSGFGHMIKGPF